MAVKSWTYSAPFIFQRTPPVMAGVVINLDDLECWKKEVDIRLHIRVLYSPNVFRIPLKAALLSF